MRIIYIRLENFIAINAAMKGLRVYELSFENIDQPIIQLYGPNKCGKTVTLHQLHPFSNINFSGDDRNDLPLILPGEIGIKNIVYEADDGCVYNITHTYTPNKNSHTVSSSIKKDNVELNPSGTVTTFNNIIEELFGINRYIFQFMINGTQLTSITKMNTSQRKQLVNKSMGIDIYDKIHKMSTEDYRYGNKILTSLNNTKEYILKQYGTYANLTELLRNKSMQHGELVTNIDVLKSKLNSLEGKISVIRQQNVEQELIEVTNQINMYDSIASTLGNFSDTEYERLVDEQIVINNSLSEKRNNKLLIMKDLDNLYEKRDTNLNRVEHNRRAMNDYNNMLHMAKDLEDKINSIPVNIEIESSSSYLCNMRNLGLTINSIGKEILTSLNEKHLKMFTTMLLKGIDIPDFLIREGNVLMDTDKEKAVVSRMKNILNNVQGEYFDDCVNCNMCIYRKSHDTLQSYFKSYQSATSNSLTAYDIDQFNHAYKNIQTINRLIQTDVAPELQMLFNFENIINNIGEKKYCINVDEIKELITEAGNIELRNKYVQQLHEVNESISNMKNLIDNITEDTDITPIQQQINDLASRTKTLDEEIFQLNQTLMTNENNRSSFSRIKNINIKELRKRFEKLSKLSNILISSESEYNMYVSQYGDLNNQLTLITRELNELKNVDMQYQRTLNEIEMNSTICDKERIIAEATSSTKGKPIIAIREKFEECLLLTNRLLNVMYDSEIEMLNPIIDESQFALPFRSNCNTSSDIRYGSQSETTMLSLALSLSLASSFTKNNKCCSYNIPSIDEIDAYLDSHMRDKFILMLTEIMSTLKMEQMFIISHNVLPDQYSNIVYTKDITK